MRINCKIPFWSDQMLASVSKYEFSKTKHFIYSSNSNSHFAIKEENGCWNSSNKNNEVCTTGTLQRAFWKQMLGKDHQREPSCPTISQPYTLSQPHSSVQRILNSAPWFYVYSSLRLVIPIFEVWYVDPLHQNLLGGTVIHASHYCHYLLTGPSHETVNCTRSKSITLFTTAFPTTKIIFDKE